MQNIKFTEANTMTLKQTDYWKAFLEHKHKFRHESVSTCTACQYKEICTPCPFEFGVTKNCIDECEWVFDKLSKDISNNSKKRVMICNDISFSSKGIYKSNDLVFNSNDTTKYLLEIISESKEGMVFDEIINVFAKHFGLEKKHVQNDIMFVMNGLISRKIVDFS